MFSPDIYLIRKIPFLEVIRQNFDVNIANRDYIVQQFDCMLFRLIRNICGKKNYIEQIVFLDCNGARSKTEEIDSIVEETLTEHNAEQAFTVKYNDNVQFPTKIYGSYLYPAGEYEAVLITLGEGEGSNWWCVLFPPLCFLDFANGTTVEAAEDDLEMKEPEQEVKVKFALLEWLGLS